MIHEVSLLCQWNYVETGANPADDASRGTLGTRMFFRVRREFSVIAEGQQIFGRRLKPREKTSRTERCFLPSPLTFKIFIGLHLRQSYWNHVDGHVKKCPKTHIILIKISWSLVAVLP